MVLANASSTVPERAGCRASFALPLESCEPVSFRPLPVVSAPPMTGEPAMLSVSRTFCAGKTSKRCLPSGSHVWHQAQLSPKARMVPISNGNLLLLNGKRDFAWTSLRGWQVGDGDRSTFPKGLLFL